MKSVADAYSAKLIKEGTLKESQHQKIVQQTSSYFEEEFKESEKYKPSIAQIKDPKFKGSRAMTHKWEDMEFS